MSAVFNHPSTAAFGLYNIIGGVSPETEARFEKISNKSDRETAIQALTITNILGWFFCPIIGVVHILWGAIAHSSKAASKEEKAFAKGLIARGVGEILLGPGMVIVDLVFTLGRQATKQRYASL